MNGILPVLRNVLWLVYNVVRVVVVGGVDAHMLNFWVSVFFPKLVTSNCILKVNKEVQRKALGGLKTLSCYNFLLTVNTSCLYIVH